MVTFDGPGGGIGSASINGAPQNHTPPVNRRALILLQGVARYETKRRPECGIRPSAGAEFKVAIDKTKPGAEGLFILVAIVIAP
jgi:hypothetical protein